MDTIDYMNGKIAVYKEFEELLNYCTGTKNDTEVLKRHCEKSIALQNYFIQLSLSRMEEDFVE